MINGKGWFVNIISSLAAGETPDMSPTNEWSIYRIRDFFQSLSETRIDRVSRRGWSTLDHPDLGLLQWKLGVSPFKGYYFFLRVNGRPVLSQTGYKGSLRDDARPEWTAAAENPQKIEVEEWLHRTT